jgi:predicted RNase H-like nuclease (RuvC/YqgF family)
MKQRLGITLTIMLLAFIFISGCQEQIQQQENIETPSEKQARLIVIENNQLKEQIQQINSYNQKMNKKYERTIKTLEDKVREYKQKNTELNKMLEQGTQEYIQQAIKEIMVISSKETKQLKAEIEKLKSTIAELGGEVQE